MPNMPLEYVSYALIGACAGLLSGLLGVSGGIITVPALFLLFSWMAFPEGYEMYFAIGTSLAAMIFSSISSTLSHNRRGAVLWDLFLRMAPGILFGSFLGAFIAERLSGVILERIFGIFAIILSCYFIIFKRVVEEGKQRLASFFLMAFIGFITATCANILGIGGGTILLPLLLAIRVPEKKSIGTSAACGMVITILGTIAYLYFGQKHPDHALTFGYVYVPAFITIGITTLLTAPLGVKWAHLLAPLVLRRIFGIVLLCTGFSLIFS